MESFGFRCFHNSCSGKHWRDVRERFEGLRLHRPPAPQPPEPRDEDGDTPAAGASAPRDQTGRSRRRPYLEPPKPQDRDAPPPARAGRSISRAPEGGAGGARGRRPGPLAAPSPLDQLNKDPMFRDVGIVWTAVRKRGKRIEGATARGRSVCWDNAGDLLKLSQREAVVADAIGVVRFSSVKGQLSWRRAATLILQIAEKRPHRYRGPHPARHGRSDPERPRRRLIIRAQRKRSRYSNSFKNCVRIAAIRTLPTRRLAYLSIAAVSTCIRPPLRAWLSTPGGHNRLYPVAEMHAGLLAAEFVRVKDFRVQVNKKRLRIDLWKGPISALGGDETEIVTDEAE